MGSQTELSIINHSINISPHQIACCRTQQVNGGRCRPFKRSPGFHWSAHGLCVANFAVLIVNYKKLKPISEGAVKDLRDWLFFDLQFKPGQNHFQFIPQVNLLTFSRPEGSARFCCFFQGFTRLFVTDSLWTLFPESPKSLNSVR